MIKIERDETAPAFLLATTRKWHRETQDAISHYSAGGNPAVGFTFKAYGDKKLKAELLRFFSKCAYCESIYAPTSDGDIEHFRPKGSVDEKNPKTPGYYWLANDWNNLLLSCQHCNQNRIHVLENGDELSGGKQDQFPLSDESKRVTTHAATAAEFAAEEAVRLLINPCKENPEDHLQYEDTEAVVQPTTPKGIASVKVYCLQRPVLVRERKKQLILLFTQIARVKRELERSNNDSSPTQKAFFESEFDALKEFTKPDALYAGMCRQFVRKFLADNGLT